MSEHKQGERFGGWTLKELLGMGGNGEVWKAFDAQGNEGAIKILKRQFRKPEDSRYKRFRDEILALKRLGPMDGILPLIDSELPESPSKASPPWFVMPLAEGLKKSLGMNPPLRDVVVSIASIADTLAALHVKNTYHRDIKPDNLYRNAERAIVGDFGLVEYPEKEDVTAEGETVGPRHYMAGEMILDAKNADGGPADVFSLAKTLWVLATGFNFPPPGQQRLEHTPYTIQTIRSDRLAFLLDRLIERSTDADPRKRPTMAEFAKELHLWLAPRASASPQVDISDISADLVDLVETAQRQKENEQRLIALVEKEVLPELKKCVEELMEDLAKAPSFSVTPVASSAITQVFQYSLPAIGNPILVHGIELITMVKSECSNCLISGFTLWLYPDGAVHIGAAHSVFPFRGFGSGNVQWKVKEEFHAGTGIQNAAVMEICDGLKENLRAAVQKLAQEIRMPQSNPLLGAVSTVLTPSDDDDSQPQSSPEATEDSNCDPKQEPST
jgi:serine/threonine protein kinase